MTGDRRGFARGLVATIIFVMILAAGPAADARPLDAGRRPGPALGHQEQAVAERLFQSLEAARVAQRDRAVLELAFELVDRYRAFADNDRVLLLAARSAWRLGDRPLARQLLSELRAGWPASAVVTEASALAAAIDPAGPADEVPAVVTAPAPTPPPPLSPPEKGVAAAELPREFAPVAPPPVPPGVTVVAAAPLDPGLIGLLYAATGEEGGEGAALAAGAQMAVEHAARDGWRRVRLRLADTAGDPVAAALAARRLAAREGVVAMIGAVAAPAAAATAAVADAWAVPLLLPNADSARLSDFGPAIVATDLLAARDARLLARLAVTVLRRPRAAVLYPGTPAGELACAAFVTALRGAGGRLVATVACADDGTVAPEELSRLAEARPELLYLPVLPAAALRLAPRLTAAGLPADVRWLGPSSWDGALVVSEADSTLRRAIFPAAEAVWPAGWVDAFRRDWAPAGPPGEGAAAARAALRAYAAVRLVVEAMSDCGLAPTRPCLIDALRRRWGRLLDADVSAVEAVRCSRTLGDAVVVPAAEAPPVTGRVP